jgi:peroxiredoxin
MLLPFLCEGAPQRLELSLEQHCRTFTPSAGRTGPRFRASGRRRRWRCHLGNYREKTPVLLAMMRGLYCAFCRRHIAQLGRARQKLIAVGVEALAIVGMRPERLRLYYQYHPVGVPIAADPDLITHQAYGVPQPPLTPEVLQAVASRHVELARKLEIAAPIRWRSSGCSPNATDSNPSPRSLSTVVIGLTAMGASLPVNSWSIGPASFAGSTSRVRERAWPDWRGSRATTSCSRPLEH